MIYSLFIAIVILYRLISSKIFEDNISKKELILNLALLFITFISYIISSFKVSELIIYSHFYLALLYISMRNYMHIKNKPVLNSSKLIKASQLFMAIMIIACLAGVKENLNYYYSYNEIIENVSAALSLEYRNLAFDFIKLLSAIIGIIYLKHSFDSIFDENTYIKAININSPYESNQAANDASNDLSNISSTQSKLNAFYNEYGITSRQIEIINLIVAGDSNKEISEKLFITEGTVKTHIYNIYKKVDVSSRTQLLNIILKD